MYMYKDCFILCHSFNTIISIDNFYNFKEYKSLLFEITD